jgi:hypothetical protein
MDEMHGDDMVTDEDIATIIRSGEAGIADLLAVYERAEALYLVAAKATTEATVIVAGSHAGNVAR